MKRITESSCPISSPLCSGGGCGQLHPMGCVELCGHGAEFLCGPAQQVENPDGVALKPVRGSVALQCFLQPTIAGNRWASQQIAAPANRLHHQRIVVITVFVFGRLASAINTFHSAGMSKCANPDLVGNGYARFILATAVISEPHGLIHSTGCFAPGATEIFPGSACKFNAAANFTFASNERSGFAPAFLLVVHSGHPINRNAMLLCKSYQLEGIVSTGSNFARLPSGDARLRNASPTGNFRLRKGGWLPPQALDDFGYCTHGALVYAHSHRNAIPHRIICFGIV